MQRFFSHDSFMDRLIDGKAAKLSVYCDGETFFEKKSKSW